MAWPWHVLCILNTSGLWLELKFILQQQLKDRSRSGAVVQGNVKERKKTRSKRRLPARKSSLEQLRIRQQWEDNTGKGELGGSVLGSAGKGCSQWLLSGCTVTSTLYLSMDKKVFYCPWKGLSQRCSHSALPGVSPDGTMPIVRATTSSRHGKWEWTHIVQLLFENCRSLVQFTCRLAQTLPAGCSLCLCNAAQFLQVRDCMGSSLLVPQPHHIEQSETQPPYVD